jgi:toxin ParE1/3/4
MPAKWKVRLSAAARRDFGEIIRWTTKTFGKAQARRYGDTINRVLEQLVAGPELPTSRARPDLGPQVRVVAIARQGRRASHLLVYRSTAGSDLEVVRILHAAMDMARHVPDRAGSA